MISLIIPPKDQVSRAAKMLAEEYVRFDLFVILFQNAADLCRVLPPTLSPESIVNPSCLPLPPPNKD